MERITMANKTVVIETDKGRITAELEMDRAPITSGNFADLVGRGFYDGLTFHRYEPGFVIQGGDPNGDGTGGFIDPDTGSERRIKLEVLPDLKHDRAGTLAMARSSDPNSASCQFYITLKDTPFLDNSYAVFGYVTDGLDVVSLIRRGDKIKSIAFAD
jgi:peptidyl-prolyl cis-trans isomerase B (cyclophilin B)